MKKYLITAFISILMAGAFFSPEAKATPAGLTYQGRLVKNNLPVDGANVQLTIKVTSPGVNECVLYEENHTLNMTGSDGIFTVKIGGGTRTVNDKGFGLSQVFSNSGTAISSLICTGGLTSYTSASTDTRNVYVSFYDGVDTVAFSSPYVIQSVPYALEAERLAGKSSTDFLQVTTDTTQSKLNDVMAPTPYTELLALINGTTTQYAKTGSASFTSDVNLNSHKITGVLTPTASTDATNKSYVDGNVGGKAADTATLNALVVGDSGKVLSWSGTQWTATAPTSDSSKLPLAGGTMTGPIAMGSNNITGLGYLTQNAGKYFQIGSYDDAAETTLAGTLLAAHKGATWYNTTTNELKYWSGTQVKSMSTSFANQSANQIMAGPASGGAAAPAFRSLVEADIPQLTLASKVLNSATTATSANTASSIVARDASGDFTAAHISLSNATFKDSGSNTVTLQAPTTVTTSYVLKLPAATVAGDAGKVLSVDGVGQLSWIAAATGSVTSVGVTAPIASTGGASPTLSIAKSDASTNGYLASADFTTFNNKQSTALANANIWVGNGSGVATPVAVSGDATIANTGAFTVTGLRGKTVSVTLPTASGQVLRYDGTSSYVPAFLSLADMRSTVVPGNTIYPATSCTGAQTMTWSSLTDTMACTTIAIADSQITYASQAANKFLASPSGAAGAPTYRTIASVDLPVTGTGGAIVNGGNSFGAASSIGNNDAYDLSLKTNNTARMTILSGGNVGIGTSSPSGILEVSSAGSTSNINFYNTNVNGREIVKFQNTGGGGNFDFRIYGTGYSETLFGQSMSGSSAWLGFSSMYLGTYSASDVIFGSNNLERMRLTSSGNFGIGTTTPTEKLTVAGGQALFGPNDSTNSYINFYNTLYKVGANSGLELITKNADVIRMIEGSTERMRIASGGNVGIGTAAPASKLHVGAAPTATANYGLLSLGSGAFDGTTSGFFTGSASGTVDAINTASSFAGNLVDYQVAGVSKFKVDASGNVTSAGSTTLTGATTTSGNFSQTGSATFSSGTGAISLNGPTTIAANQNFAMSSGTGTFTQTYTGTSTANSVTANSVTTNPAVSYSANGLTSGSILSLTSTSTAAASGNTGLNIAISGANATSGITRTGLSSAVTATGSTSTNVGGYFSASGATNNYGLIVANGNVGIGTTSPSQLLDVNGIIKASGVYIGNSKYLANGELNAAATAPYSDPHPGFQYDAKFGGNNRGIAVGGISYFASNVGIGTATPSGALDVNGTFYARSNSVFTVGAFSDPDIGTSYDAKFGGTGRGIAVKGVSYFGSNVGIGTSTPSAPLHIASSAAALDILRVQNTSNTAYSSIGFFDETNTQKGSFGYANTGVGGVYGGKVFFNGSGTDVVFGNAGAANITMKSGGNVGIGTTNPGQVLHVNGSGLFGDTTTASKAWINGTINGYSTASAPDYSWWYNSTTGMFHPALDTIAFTTWGSERLRITAAGNVGIGTTAPKRALHIAATGNGTEPSLVLENTGNASGLKIWNWWVQNNGNLQLDDVNDAFSSGTTRLAIAKTGSVGIGTTSPGAKLDITDTGTTTSAIIVPRAGNFTGTSANGMIRYNTTSTLFEFYQNGAWVNYTTVSDGRLKTNVVPVTDGLDIINQLNPVFYDWDRRNPKASGFADKHQVGFIAQEVEEVLPEVVNEGEDSYRSLEYGKIVSVVVAAVKELYSKVLGMDREIASVRAENAQLKANDEAKTKEMAELKARLDKLEQALNSK